MEKSLLVPVFHSVVNQAKKDVSEEKRRLMEELEFKLEELILNDHNVAKEVERLRNNIEVAPRWVIAARAFVRPFITGVLTITFISLIAVSIYAVTHNWNQYEKIKDIMMVFLGIYGSIIGFWFGEHTAMKKQAEIVQESGGR